MTPVDRATDAVVQLATALHDGTADARVTALACHLTATADQLLADQPDHPLNRVLADCRRALSDHGDDRAHLARAIAAAFDRSGLPALTGGDR